MITGSAALHRYGLTGVPGDVVDLLIPHRSGVRDAAFVRVHPTRRMPELFCFDGEIRYALVPRAVADAVRGLPDLADVRAVTAQAVQRGMCSIPWLTDELAAGPRRGSAGLRKVLAEVADGVRSCAEADLRDLIVWARLPMPMFNPRLFSGQAFIASTDCWWPEAGVAAEVDSRAWHLSPKDWESTLARHARISAYGINVLHFTQGRSRLTAGAWQSPFTVRSPPAVRFLTSARYPHGEGRPATLAEWIRANVSHSSPGPWSRLGSRYAGTMQVPAWPSRARPMFSGLVMMACLPPRSR